MVGPYSWWRHQMETFSALLALCAGNSSLSGEFPAQRPVTRSFDVSFDLHPNKRSSKQWWGWWFETPLCPLWRHRNAIANPRLWPCHVTVTCKLWSYEAIIRKYSGQNGEISSSLSWVSLWKSPWDIKWADPSVITRKPLNRYVNWPLDEVIYKIISSSST